MQNQPFARPADLAPRMHTLLRQDMITNDKTAPVAYLAPSTAASKTTMPTQKKNMSAPRTLQDDIAEGTTCIAEGNFSNKRKVNGMHAVLLNGF